MISQPVDGENSEEASSQSAFVDSATSPEPLDSVCLVQIGDMGTFGWFEVSSASAKQLCKEKTVVCQTGRGPELGIVKSDLCLQADRLNDHTIEIDQSSEFLGAAGQGDEFAPTGNPGRPDDHDSEVELSRPVSGTILREATSEDFLAKERFGRNKNEAIEHCNQWISNQGFSDLIIDAETTLDGSNVFFHFLGPMSQELNLKTEELVKQYDQVAKVKQFTEAVELGCGPNCGSDGSGCSTSGNCSSCSIKSACKTK